MKVNSGQSKNLTKAAGAQAQGTAGKKKMSKADIEAKLKAKFGDIPKKKKAPVEDKADIKTKSAGKGAEAADPGFGDIGKNDPKSAETQEKLKGILKGGGFHFSDKERETLSKILK